MSSDRLGGVNPLGAGGFQRSHLAKAALRSVATATMLLVVYYVVPVEHRHHQSVVIRLGVALALFVAVLASEVRAIQNHRQPMLRAGVSMATVIPLFLVLFAWIYFTMSGLDRGTSVPRSTAPKLCI